MRRRSQTQVVVPSDGWAEVPLNPQGDWMPAFAADLPPSATTAQAVVASQAVGASATTLDLDWDLDEPDLFDDVADAGPEISVAAAARPQDPSSLAEPPALQLAPVRQLGEPVSEPARATATVQPDRSVTATAPRPPAGRRVAVIGVFAVVAFAAVAAVRHDGAHGQLEPAAVAPAAVVDGTSLEISRGVAAAVDRAGLLARRAEQQQRRELAAQRRVRARKAAATKRARERRRARVAAPVVVRPQDRVAPAPAPAPAAVTAPPARKSSGESARSTADREFGL